LRCVALLSGGLDSILAIKVVLEQGVDVEALNFMTVFCTWTPKNSGCSAARTAVRQLGVGLKVVETSAEVLEVVKDPKHGYGSELNPCLDCRILMFRKAHRYMQETGAAFLITGEVLGERPMSQRREAMKLIDREAGVDGLVVRPLCARRLEPSIPEKNGWIDRDRLLNISGRSRKPQIQLAEQYGIRDYPCPAGGCKLTDPGFALRMRDLMGHCPDFGLNDVHLLKVGRHFRLSGQVKAVVGRDEQENERLAALSRGDDTLLELVDVPGPLTVVRGPADEQEIRLAAAITARYSRARGRETARVAISGRECPETRYVDVAPATEERLAEFMIASVKTAAGVGKRVRMGKRKAHGRVVGGSGVSSAGG